MNLEIFTEIKLNDYICYIIIIGLLGYIYLDSPIPNSFNLNDKYKYNYFVFTFIFIFSCSLVFTNYIVCGILIIILYEITNKIDIEERRKNKKTNNKNNINTNNSNTNNSNTNNINTNNSNTNNINTNNINTNNSNTNNINTNNSNTNNINTNNSNTNNINTNNSNTNMRSMVSCESNIQNVKWEQTLEENLVDNTKLLSTKNILHNPTPRYQAILPDINCSSLYD